MIGFYMEPSETFRGKKGPGLLDPNLSELKFIHPEPASDRR
jgi:hypothetical protein